jgi:hypothetical protein
MTTRSPHSTRRDNLRTRVRGRDRGLRRRGIADGRAVDGRRHAADRGRRDVRHAVRVNVGLGDGGRRRAGHALARVETRVQVTDRDECKSDECPLKAGVRRRYDHPTMTVSAPSALTIQMLAWLAGRPRTYGEAMDAWRTSCPRLSIWEDAIADDLIRVRRAGPGVARDLAVVELTRDGHATLDGYERR